MSPRELVEQMDALAEQPDPNASFTVVFVPPENPDSANLARLTEYARLILSRLEGQHPRPRPPEREATRSWVSQREAARLAGVREQVIREAVRSGALEHSKPGKRTVRIKRDSLDGWLATMRTTTWRP